MGGSRNTHSAGGRGNAKRSATRMQGCSKWLGAVPALFVLWLTWFYLPPTLPVTSLTMSDVKFWAGLGPSSWSLSLQIPASLATKDDEYLCTAMSLERRHQTIKSFVPRAKTEVVHHMILSTVSSKSRLSTNVHTC